jgi:hypothetical protein
VGVLTLPNFLWAGSSLAQYLAHIMSKA